ncbi:MAG: LD-carboxypeptidase [Nitrospirota bacterium]
MDKPFEKPRALPAGGTIGVIAPAGRVAEMDAVHRGADVLRALGFKVVLGQHLEKVNRYLAGTDKARSDDFLAMMQDPEIDAVFCARGGYGSSRIIPHIDKVAHLSNKILVGCSDITTLLLYLSEQHRMVTFHGPMVATSFGSPSYTGDIAGLIRMLSGEAISMPAPNSIVLKAGHAEGILTGGCLTLICTTIGTPYEIETKNRILFIEDIAEAPYRIDRMLTYLKHLKKFDPIRGLIFGQMPDCQPEALPEMIQEIFADFDFPILFSFPSGHGDAHFTLPLGVPVRMETHPPTVTMLAEAVSK